MKYYRSFDAGQQVAWAGDQQEFVATVVTGIATLSQTLEDGRTQTVGLLLPSDFFGRPGRAFVHFDLTANSALTLCCFRRDQFEKLIVEMPHIGQRLLEQSLNELDAAREWMLVLGRKTAREKIASLLINFARRDAAQQQNVLREGISFELPLTRASMADYLGLTLETVSRQISAFKQDRIIQLEGNHGIIIHDFETLLVQSVYDADKDLPA